MKKRYLSIAEYRDRYLKALGKVKVVSFEFIRDERDRRGIWRLEDFLSLPKGQSKIAILWEKARTETRRQILKRIGAEPDKGYGYYHWSNLPRSNSTSLFCPPPPPGIQNRIEDSEQAIEILESDVKSWIQEFFGVNLVD